MLLSLNLIIPDSLGYFTSGNRNRKNGKSGQSATLIFKMLDELIELVKLIKNQIAVDSPVKPNTVKQYLKRTAVGIGDDCNNLEKTVHSLNKYGFFGLHASGLVYIRDTMVTLSRYLKLILAVLALFVENSIEQIISKNIKYKEYTALTIQCEKLENLTVPEPENLKNRLLSFKNEIPKQDDKDFEAMLNYISLAAQDIDAKLENF